jgi:lysozyme family protein
VDFFDYAIGKTLPLEGGYSNNPNDRGRETKCGITEAIFRDALKWRIISGVNSVKDLTDDQIKIIYRTLYWQPIRLNEVEDKEIAAEIFDTSVNSGPGKATLIAQLALDYLGEKLTVDGVMGSITIGLINKWCRKDPRALFVCLNGFQFIHFVAIVDGDLIEEIQKRVKSDASQSTFSRGWTKRIQDYRHT